MMDEYQKQAEDFLAKTKTKFEARYLRTGRHFDDDETDRDIYEITLMRGNRAYRFNFGQSVIHSGRFFFYGPKGKELMNERKQKPGYETAKNKNFEEPTPYDVLSCITKSDPGTFEDFCSEFGYDTDSKKAEKTYHAVKEEWLNIKILFSDDEIRELQEIN